MQEGSEILFTIRTANVAQRETTGDITAINVSYDAFVDDIQVRAFFSKAKGKVLQQSNSMGKNQILDTFNQ